MNKKLQDTIKMLDSVDRNVVAHFNNNSFDLKWYKLKRSDEYNMASRVFYAMPEIIEKNCRDKIIGLGENLMLGSYILVKKGAEDFTGDLKEILFDSYSMVTPGGMETLNKYLDYFNYCIEFGKNIAKGVIK